MQNRKCLAVWLGLTAYAEANSLQMRISDLKHQGLDIDVLLLLEHPPVITLGRNAQQHNLLVQENRLESLEIELWRVDRGGDVTFHGPGQLVGYPVLFLRKDERDVHGYMHNLEESVIRLLMSFEIKARREEHLTGVWTDKGKIAAMGVHLRRWITRHGFALNVTTDLSYFDLIVPCGIAGRKVTSMKETVAGEFKMEEVFSRYIPLFGDIFHREMEVVGKSVLESRLAAYEAAI
ncbi:MAG TPA: lipoyl(octanoyl) transferase LipB [Acidobacteriota bacterium]|nr:lipoyl(octanoyl) transferase LipB [Acidobacteriota bacterium]